MQPSITMCPVTVYEDWQEFLLHRITAVPVHVFLPAVGEDTRRLVERLCVDSEVYAVYVVAEASGLLSEPLPDCDTPVFVVTDEAEAKAFATKLVSGDLDVLENAVNGDDMLYKFLAAHPT